MSLSIVIPTFRRPESLARLLDSLRADPSLPDRARIIIADNDANASARPVVENFREQVSNTVDYTIVAEPGVANARNGAMALAGTDRILFLDDDMSVAPGYVGAILDIANRTNATMTFSRVDARFDSAAATAAAWAAPLFSRNDAGPSRVIDDVFGTGGCLLSLHGIDLPQPPFDPALNATGGEDDALFSALREQGGRSAWCADAIAFEHVPEHRLKPRYVWARHFAYGQSPTRDCADHGLRGWPGIAGWMAVGAVQSALGALSFLGLSALRRPSALQALARMAEGTGKIFWWDGLSPRLYGANAR